MKQQQWWCQVRRLSTGASPASSSRSCSTVAMNEGFPIILKAFIFLLEKRFNARLFISLSWAAWNAFLPTGEEPLPSATSVIPAPKLVWSEADDWGHSGQKWEGKTASQIFDSFTVSAINEKQHHAQDYFLRPSENNHIKVGLINNSPLLT